MVFLLLLAVLAALDGGVLLVDANAPGSFHNISCTDPGLQAALLAASSVYNNYSTDDFLFRPYLVLQAQAQVVEGMLYIADVKISRTVCRKGSSQDLLGCSFPDVKMSGTDCRKGSSQDLLSCSFQPPGTLQKTLRCHVEVWTVPWLHKTTTRVFTCYF